MAEFYIISEDGPVTSVGLRGELDSQGTEDVETEFNEVVITAGRDVLVDFSEVTFLASLGVRMLIATTRALAVKGKRLVVHSPQEMVRESIVGAALDEIIGLADSAEDAERLLNV